MSALPGKLSDLLELGVRDAQACEAQPSVYLLDMGDWHRARADGRCAVCLAGSVIAQTLKMDPTVTTRIWFGHDTHPDIEGHRGKLSALNEMRVGRFDEAAGFLQITIQAAQEDAVSTARGKIRDALPWEDEEEKAPDMRAPWSVYLDAVDLLRGVGL